MVIKLRYPHVSQAGMAQKFKVRMHIVTHTRSQCSSPTNACMWIRKGLSYHAGHQEVSRCHTRGKSEESIAQSRKHTSKGSTLALKLGANVTRSPKQWPHKRTDVLQKTVLNKFPATTFSQIPCPFIARVSGGE